MLQAEVTEAHCCISWGAKLQNSARVGTLDGLWLLASWVTGSTPPQSQTETPQMPLMHQQFQNPSHPDPPKQQWEFHELSSGVWVDSQRGSPTPTRARETSSHRLLLIDLFFSLAGRRERTEAFSDRFSQKTFISRFQHRKYLNSPLWKERPFLYSVYNH